jgi:hypothetical protein
VAEYEAALEGAGFEVQSLALMARLQLAIEEQRALVEAADATDQFEACLAAALALAQQPP